MNPITTKTLAEIIAIACGSESGIEDVVEALARKGAYDRYLPAGVDRFAVRRRCRGHADIEIADAAGIGHVGIEVKITSQVNYGRYGREDYTSQLDEMASRVTVLLIITTPARAERETWPRGAIVLTLNDVARAAQAVGLTDRDIIAVSLGDAA